MINSQSLTVAPTVAERRIQRAEVLASQFALWIACKTKDGRVVFAIPSQSVAGKFHLATLEKCGCWDSVRRSGACKHRRAVRIALEQRGLLAPVVRPSWADVIIEEEIAA